MESWECVEVCPDCGYENVYQNLDPIANGYKAICEGCGKEIMLCDECIHSDDYKGCDWREVRDENGRIIGGICFRGETRRGEWK